MEDKYYGNIDQVVSDTQLDFQLEEIRTNGYTIIENLLTSDELIAYRGKIDRTYRQQEHEFGLENLVAIKEKNVCRMPLKYDDYFINIATNKTVMTIVERILGDYYILNLQNAIINMPGEEHHQSSWHRDLPHQNFVISKPLAVNALFCIDDFSEVSGGTMLIPYTHKTEKIPSDTYIKKNRLIVNAKAGAVIVFDSMLFHRASYNSSNQIRRAVNHVYTVPILKQFYDYPRALGGRFSQDPRLARLLGYTSQTPIDDVKWRQQR